MNKAFKVGDLMIIHDHISLFVVNPLWERTIRNWDPVSPI